MKNFKRKNKIVLCLFLILFGILILFKVKKDNNIGKIVKHDEENYIVYNTTQLNLNGLSIGVGNFDSGEKGTVALWLSEESKPGEPVHQRVKVGDKIEIAGYKIYIIDIGKDGNKNLDRYVELKIVSD